MSTESVIQWAHQGGAREAPSNTIKAFRKALNDAGEANVGLEMDVHVTRDGELVVIHDKSLERTTNGRGRVGRHSLEALTRLNAAWWWTEGEVDNHRPGAYHPFRTSTNDVGIPTLGDVFKEWREHQPLVPITIEVKAFRAVSALAATLQDCTEEERSQITVTSFRHLVVSWLSWKLRRGARGVGLAPGTGWMFAFLVAAELGLPWTRTRYTRLQIPVRLGLPFATPRAISFAQKMRVWGPSRTTDDQRLQVDVWTIDERDTMKALLELGVNGIMTDKPAVLREVVASYLRVTATAAAP